jgi:hypothetical protein
MSKVRFPSELNARRGMVAVQVAILLTALTAVLAIAAEGGLLLSVRRHAQATADAAALAAASDLFEYYFSNKGTDTASNTAQTSATDIAVANGFNSSDVTVRLSGSNYLGGPHAGTPVPRGYAEVSVTYYLPRSFSNVFKVFGQDTIPDPIPVSARAVARGRMWADTHVPAVLVLDPSASGSTGGNLQSLTVNGGSIVLNSGSSPAPDPLRYLPEPVQPPKADWYQDGNNNIIIPTGSYGVDASDTYNNLNNISSAGTTNQVYFQQASTGNNGVVYIASGGFALSDSMNYQMDPNSSGGVMIFYAGTGAGDTITLGGNNNASLVLDAPSSGIYKGLAYFQARSSTAAVSIGGNEPVTVTGSVYAPNASVEIDGSGSQTVGSQLIVKDLIVNGNASVNFTRSTIARSRQLQLVE